MKDYIVTRKDVTSRRFDGTPCKPSRRPHVHSSPVNGITKASEAATDSIDSRSDYFHKFKQHRIKKFAIVITRSPENCECDLLISRSHCCKVCNRKLCVGGENL
jgi:hypothetical protein